MIQNTHENREALKAALVRLMEMKHHTTEDPNPVVEVRVDDTWQKLGSALAFNMLRHCRRPSLIRVMIEKRCWWRFRNTINLAKPLTKRRAKLMVQIKKSNDKQRAARHRREFEEDLVKAGLNI